MNRLGFLIFILGFCLGSWAISLVGFLIYEFSRPIELLAFFSSGRRG